MLTRFFIIILLTRSLEVCSQISINELMIDPSPTVSLPEYEYIELYNTSNDSVCLTNWILRGETTNCIFPSKIIAPHAYLIVAPQSAQGYFDSYGTCLYCSHFPALTNDGKLIELFDNKNHLIDFVSYKDIWYESDFKQNGGWSLEKKDPDSRCSCAENWTASSNILGGTPGKTNSINETFNPQTFNITNIGEVTDSSCTVFFSGQMDSTSILNTQNYTIDHGIGNPFRCISNSPFYNEVTLIYSTLLHKGNIYRLTASSAIKNCGTIHLSKNETVRFALSDSVYKNDIIINEILFDPLPESVDFVELYNRSSKIISLSDIYIANKDIKTNMIKEYAQICNQGLLLFPNEFIVISEDSKKIQSQYKTAEVFSACDITSLPGFPDDEGIICIITKQGSILDEFHYNSDMHNKQLSNKQGISLERINTEVSASEPTNWHSASWDCGYATPGYKNSQSQNTMQSSQLLTISPYVFSPDNDGFDDAVSIAYLFPEEGYTASIRIFNLNGSLLKSIVANKPMSVSGTIFWDGTTDNGLLPAGMYIIECEAFNEKGKHLAYKTSCAIAY